MSKNLPPDIELTPENLHVAIVAALRCLLIIEGTAGVIGGSGHYPKAALQLLDASTVIRKNLSTISPRLRHVTLEDFIK